MIRPVIPKPSGGWAVEPDLRDHAAAPRTSSSASAWPRASGSSSSRAGKIMRRVLKARELGLPEGDPSTLEVPA
jgi:acetyl-CoA synthetase